MHVVEGLATIALLFPWLRPIHRQRLIRRWSQRLLRVFAVSLRVQGTLHRPARPGLLVVANHVSWLDIFVLNATHPARFVAKAELRRWPLIGWLIAGVGTLFIQRDSRRHTHEANRVAERALASGDVVAVFPEGATTDGSHVRSFHGSLLQPIVDLRGDVQPIAIRYRRHDEAPATAAAYVGDMTFLRSVWRIAGEPRLLVDLHLTPPLPATERHRRELARAAEAAIRSALGLSADGSAPGISGDPRASSP